MDDFEENDLDIGAWLAARPTLTEERSHPNHWFNRGADLHASAGALWYAMENDAQLQIAQVLGVSSGSEALHRWHISLNGLWQK